MARRSVVGETLLRVMGTLFVLAVLFTSAFGEIDTPVVEKKPGPNLIARQSDEMIRLAEQMIEHGREGHTDEIVKYGKEMLRSTQILVKQVRAERGEKDPALPHLSKVVSTGRRAVKEGEAGRLSPALDAARQALHHARLGRDLLGNP
jgi:hypothetical protein